MEDPKHLGVSIGSIKAKAVGLAGKIKDKVMNIDYKDKKVQKIGGGIALSLALVVGGLLYRSSLEGFEVFLGKESLGMVREQEDFNNIYDELQKELSETYDMEVVLDSDIKFEDTYVRNKNLSALEEVKLDLKDKVSFLVQGYTLEIDGEKVGSLKTKEEIENLLKRIQEPFLAEKSDNEKIIEVGIAEDIKIVMEDLPIYKISNEDKLYEHLTNGGEEVKTHIVEVGESLWTISRIYGIPEAELEEANGHKDPTKLQIGEEVKLVMPKSLVTVETKSEVEYTEKINYESIVEYDDSMFTNEKKVKVEGENGLSKILVSEVKQNGKLIDKEILSEEIIEKPVAEVVIKGTKEVPKTAATGSFLMPTRGRVSSRYGMRNGRMHRGLDIAAKTGTSIKAADGGKVVFSGNSGAFGQMIEIDHGNGYRTRYAHCSKLLVGVGTKVYKGQEIAKVGNTGRSTGSHLHLEVIKNGSHQNPSSYVK